MWDYDDEDYAPVDQGAINLLCLFASGMVLLVSVILAAVLQ